MKKFIYIISIIIIISIIAGGIIFFTNNKKSEKKINQEKSVENDNTTSFQKIQTIRSTEEKPISKDAIEATNINIYKDSVQMRVEATLKNISDKPIDGFDISIDLLDKNGKKLTTISENSTQKIDVGSSYLFTSNIVGKNYSNVVSAKIVSFERNIQQNIEDSFDQIDNIINSK